MRRRITWSIVGVSAVALLVLGLPLAAAVGQLYRKDAILQLERDASEARRRINLQGSTGAADPVEFDNRGSTQYALYSTAGHRVTGRGPERADRVVRGALQGRVTDGRIAGRTVVAIPVDGNERVIGALRTSRPATDITNRIRWTWVAMGIAAGGALAVAAALAWWQARRLSRPVDDLVAAAERLGDGDFSTRTRRSGVAELDELGAAMDATAAHLGDLVERERAFSADASHQLRTPIAALRVAIESTLMDPGTDARDTLRALLDPVDRLEGTVDDLLLLARDTHTDRAPLDLTVTLDAISERWHGPLAAASRRLSIRADPDLESPCVSATAVAEILEVLVANAYEHGVGTVTVRARIAPGATAVEVSDEGTASLDGSKIFARRASPGRGIGLALARSLAEAEGGRLLLDRSARATTFVLLLPGPVT